eukprot:GFUD01012187.1.p1 GENE.GFUD01012187.1~~GFUD01012187.1.p1  ORF type:complete len:373 (+),score=82.37 GFUD01012187.1:102-1220(+)
MPIPHQKSSFTSSSSTAQAWKLSLKDWASVHEADYLDIQLTTEQKLSHGDNKEVAYSVRVVKNCDEMSVLLMLANTRNSEDAIPKIQIETAYRIRKPSDRKPLEMYSSRSYETFHSSEDSGRSTALLQGIWLRYGGYGYKLYKLKSIYDVGTAKERSENGFFTFDFEVRIVSTPEIKFQDSALKQKHIFSENFESFYGESGDVKITCGGKEFACHKLLLTSQSPVFRAMFAHDSKENAESTVHIDDTTPEAVEEFLFFLYHGRLQRVPIPSLDFTACLVHLASKYQMGVLMGICKDILVDIVDVFNVLKIIKVVDKYPELSEISVRLGSYMKENFDDIVKNEEWSEFVTTNPSLVTNLWREMVVKKALDVKP